MAKRGSGRGTRAADETPEAPAEEPTPAPEPEAPPEEPTAPEPTPEPEAAPAPAPGQTKASGLPYRAVYRCTVGSKMYTAGEPLPKLTLEEEKRLRKLGAIERIPEDDS